jgi:hypothetical protein
MAVVCRILEGRDIRTPIKAHKRGPGATKNGVKPERVPIEYIDQMRRNAGINDDQLWKAIGQLEVGDRVKLTFMVPRMTATRETLVVEIAGVRRDRFKGKVVSRPLHRGLAKLKGNAVIEFSADQIHSIVRVQPELEDEELSEEE